MIDLNPFGFATNAIPVTYQSHNPYRLTGFHKGVDVINPDLYYFDLDMLIKYLRLQGCQDIEITFPVSPYEFFLKAKFNS